MTRLGEIPTQNREGNREEDLEGKNQRKNAVHHQAHHQVHPGAEDLGAEDQKDPDRRVPDVEGRPKPKVEEESRAPKAENPTRSVKEVPGLEPVVNRKLQLTR